MKKSRLVSVVTALVLTSTVGVVVGCSDVTETPPIIQTHTVTFRYNYDGAENDGVYKVETVTTGTAVAKPADPVRVEMQFDYWSTAAAADSPRYNFSNVIFADADLYAQWKPIGDRNPGEVILSGIAVTHEPTTTTYTVGDDLDLAGLVVTATYSDNTTAPVTVTAEMLSGYDMSAAGSQTVTITYTEGNETKTTTFNITVENGEQPPAPVTLSGIAVTHEPTTTTYTVGDDLDLAGLVVTATYSDNTTAPVTVTAEMLSGYDMNTAGSQTVTITYTEGNETKTTTFNITVENGEQPPAPVTLSGIAVTHEPTTTTYTVGDDLDLAGLVVTATYSDNTTAPVTVTAEMLSGYDMSAAGSQTVTITYEGETATFNITVEEESVVLTGITVEYSGKQYYTSGTFDRNELTVTAAYSDGHNQAVTDYTLSAFDMTAGTKTVTVTYVEGGVTKTGSFSFTVNAVTVSNIVVTNSPIKTVYETGDALDLTGLVVTATYSDKTTGTVTVTAAMLSGYDMSAVGSQTVTVTYEEKTATFGIKVNKKQYTVTFDYGYDGAPNNGVITTKLVKDGETVTPPLTTNLKRDGYTFKHWSTEQDGEACVAADYVITGATTFYAVWQMFSTAEDGVYVVGSFNDWGEAFKSSDIGHYKVAKLTDNDYKISGLTLAKDDKFKFVGFTAENSYVDWTTYVYNTATIVVIPEALMTVGITSDDDKNFAVSEYSASEDDTWTIEFGTNGNVRYVTFRLDGYNMMRDPETGEALTGTNKVAKDRAPLNVAYLVGNFTDGWQNVCDEWAFDPANPAVALVGGKYYFQNVRLKQYDEFKVFTRKSDAEQLWLGGTWAVENAISLLKDGDNLVVPADGVYNLVYDAENGVLEIYASKTLGAKVNSAPFIGDALIKSNMTVTYGADEVADYTLITETAVSGENNYTVVYHGAVLKDRYAAREPQLQGITVTTAPVKTYYAGDTFDKTDIVVTATYDHGSPVVLSASDFAVSSFTSADIAAAEALADKLNGAVTATVTVTYDGLTATTAVTFKNKLTGIAASLKSGRTFFVGDEISADDFDVYAIFNKKDTLRQSVTTHTVSPATLAATSNTVTISAHGLTKNVAVSATAVVPTGITFTTPAEIPTYRSGNRFGATGYAFTVTYNNGTTKNVAYGSVTFVSDKLNSNGTFKAVEELTENVQITVRYTEGGKTVEASTKIIVHLDVAGDKTYFVSFADGLEHYEVQMPTGQEVRADADAITAPETPTLKGFTFVGWKSESDGSRVTFPLKVRKDLSLVAEWEPETYTIEYDLNGYTGGVLGAGNPTSYTAENNEFKALTLGTVSRSYYTFDGWYTAAKDGTRVTAIDYSMLPAIGNTITLYAHWSIVTYTLEYNVGDYGNAIESKTFDINTISTVATLPSAVAVNTLGAQSGYYFIGWYSAGENGEKLTAVTADMLDDLNGTTLTIYACYSNMYTVTFDSNGGSEVVAAKVAYGSAVVKPTDPTRDGNDFGGWHLVADGVMQAAEYDFATAVNGDITLKATWKENPKNGLYLRITYDDWATSNAVKATKKSVWNSDLNRNVDEYSVENIRLAKGAIFYLAQYDAAGNATSYVKPSAATLKFYVSPSELSGIKFKSLQDDYGYLYQVEEFEAEYNDFVWNLYVQPTQVAVELINNALRDPDGTANSDVISDAEDKAVYIKGNFNRFNPSDAWSNESAQIATATVGTKYYFTDVHLNKYDQFKMYVTAEGGEGWYGIKDAAFEVGKEITLKNGDASNVFFMGESGSYNIVFDAASKKLLVEQYKTVTVSCGKGIVYAGDTLAAADFSASIDGAPATIDWVEQKAAQAGANKIKLVCGNTVAEYGFNAIAVVAIGIEVTTAPTNTQYYAGDAFDRTGMVVSVVYNNGGKTPIADYAVSALPSYANVSDMFTQAANVNLTITAEADGATYTATTAILLRNRFTGIAVEELSETPVVFVGQNVTADDIEELTVNAIFNNSNAQTLATGYALSVNTATAGTVNAVVSYAYNGTTYTAQFEVDVVAPTLTGIAVDRDNMPQYKIGQTLAKTGVVVTASYNFGSNKTVADYTLSADMTKAGTTTVTVTYIENNVTKTATFDITLGALTVAFEANGGSVVADKTITDLTGDKNKIQLPASTRKHYTLDGWYKDAAFGTVWNFVTDKVTEDVTLYAKWTAVDYTVTLVPGGEAGEYTVATAGNVTSITKAYGSTVTLPAVTVTNSGATRYTFLGWTLDLDAETIVYLDDEFTLGGDMTVYAHVDAVATRAFKFYNNDGTNAFTSRDVQIGVTPNAPAFNRTGYTFGGWYGNAACTGSAVTLGVVTEDTAELTELYAKWDPVTYTITLNAGEGTVTPASVEYTIEMQTVSLPTPTREHYTFGVWTLGGNAFTFEAGRTGDITLVADWTATTYTLAYNAGEKGASISTTTEFTVENVTSVTLLATTAVTVTAEGYHVTGWYTDSVGGTQVTTLTAANLADVHEGTLTLYAHYELNEYDVTFDLNYEGAAAAPPVKVTHGDTVSALDPETRDNYTFMHWYTTDEDTAFDFDTQITKGITLYAKWDPIVDDGRETVVSGMGNNGHGDIQKTYLVGKFGIMKSIDNTKGYFMECTGYSGEYNYQCVVTVDLKANDLVAVYIPGWTTTVPYSAVEANDNFDEDDASGYYKVKNDGTYTFYYKHYYGSTDSKEHSIYIVKMSSIAETGFDIYADSERIANLTEATIDKVMFPTRAKEWTATDITFTTGQTLTFTIENKSNVKVWLDGGKSDTLTLVSGTGSNTITVKKGGTYNVTVCQYNDQVANGEYNVWIGVPDVPVKEIALSGKSAAFKFKNATIVITLTAKASWGDTDSEEVYIGGEWNSSTRFKLDGKTTYDLSSMNIPSFLYVGFTQSGGGKYAKIAGSQFEDGKVHTVTAVDYSESWTGDNWTHTLTKSAITYK